MSTSRPRRRKPTGRWDRTRARADVVWEWSYGIWPLLMAVVFTVVVWDGVEFEQALNHDVGVHTTLATVTGVQACGDGFGDRRGCTDTVVIRFQTTGGRAVTTGTDRVSWDPVPRWVT